MTDIDRGKASAEHILVLEEVFETSSGGVSGALGFICRRMLVESYAHKPDKLGWQYLHASSRFLGVVIWVERRGFNSENERTMDFKKLVT